MMASVAGLILESFHSDREVVSVQDDQGESRSPACQLSQCC